MALSQKQILSDLPSIMNVYFLKTCDFGMDQFSANLDFPACWNTVRTQINKNQIESDRDSIRNSCDIFLYTNNSNVKSPDTCIKALAFQAPNKGPFEAQYKRQSLLFEN